LISFTNVEHKIFNKHLLCFIYFLVRVCGPKISGDIIVRGHVFFFHYCFTWSTSLSIVAFPTSCDFICVNNLGWVESTWIFMGVIPLILLHLILLHFGTKNYLSRFLIYIFITRFIDFQDPHVNHHSQQKTSNKWNFDGVVSKIQLELLLL
jgi:hypothetical protein